MTDYFLRLGSLGEIYPAQSVNRYERGQRVIVRTSRGVELAEIVRERQVLLNGQNGLASLKIVRATTSEDELLIKRLERHKRNAVESCRTALTEAGSTATILEIDQIFDGGTLVMHFLGPVDQLAESITKSIADQYESIVDTQAFAKLLSDGCGPECGTAEGGGCGSSKGGSAKKGSCSGCAVAAACQTN
ncbi:hypothetical protein [Planctomycetes bacterium K23_9]|uniref:PSP1 C-terminal domain-containing protein n=1 Tax=Stieleria marina TaxID=1930275 RepID=A0A517NXM3_9BACT|nr:hypothetical protein K239x_38860 [Planctomycetes bacterium K23_9]